LSSLHTREIVNVNNDARIFRWETA